MQVALCRVLLKQSETNKYQQNKQNTQSPIQPYARTPGRPQTQGSCVAAHSALTLELQLDCTTSFVAHWPTPGDTKEYARIRNFLTSAPRGDGDENGRSSGTSGPVASRDDGPIFFTAAKTYQESVRRGFLLTLGGFLLGTQDVLLSQHRVRRNEQTARVCAENASLMPMRRKAYSFIFHICRNFLRHLEERNYTSQNPFPSLTQK